MAIVYIHKIKESGVPFYVGIGKTRNRAFDFTKRSKFWKDFTKKYDFTVDVIYEGISYEEAKLMEMQLIKSIGRRDLGLGSLVNQTDGGDGTLHFHKVLSPETKKKISINNGMLRDDVKQKHKASLSRLETKQKQRDAKLGRTRPKLYCVACNKYIADNNFAKYHGDKCKLKIPTTT